MFESEANWSLGSSTFEHARFNAQNIKVKLPKWIPEVPNISDCFSRSYIRISIIRHEDMTNYRRGVCNEGSLQERSDNFPPCLE